VHLVRATLSESLELSPSARASDSLNVAENNGVREREPRR
jgi:hypothetical protein